MTRAQARVLLGTSALCLSMGHFARLAESWIIQDRARLALGLLNKIEREPEPKLPSRTI